MSPNSLVPTGFHRLHWILQHKQQSTLANTCLACALCTAFNYLFQDIYQLFTVSCLLSAVFFHYLLLAVYRQLSIVSCLLSAVYCQLSVSCLSYVYCQLSTVYCHLFTLSCLLSEVYCQLYTVSYLLSAVYCQMFTLICILSAV